LKPIEQWINLWMNNSLDPLLQDYLVNQFAAWKVAGFWYKDGKGRSCAPSAKLGAHGCWEFYENPSDMNDIVRELQSVRAFESFESVTPLIRTH
jgi:hypothetical protein